jgi:putative transposase
MPRPPRADEAGGLYHALNRANMRATIFHKEGDFAAFEKILYEAIQLHEVVLYSYQLMTNHYHNENRRKKQLPKNMKLEKFLMVLDLMGPPL